MVQKIVNTLRLKFGFVLVIAVTGFNLFAQEPLTLFQAIKTGLENNYSIQIQKNQA